VSRRAHRRHTIALRSFAGAGALLAVNAAAGPGLAEIVARHTEARGGATAIEAQRTVAIDVEITEPGFQVRGTWIGDRAGAMRIDIYDGEQRVFTESWRDGEAWQQMADGQVSTSSPAGARALAHGLVLPTNLTGLHEIAAHGAQLQLEPDEEIEGRLHHVLKAKLADGYVIEYVFDPENWMIVRSRTRRALHPDVDPAETVIESRYWNFRATDGVVRPFASEDVDLSTGAVLSQVRVLDVRVNAAVREQLFNRPSPRPEH